MEGLIGIVDLTKCNNEQKDGLTWLTLAMMLDGKKCAICGHIYNSRESVEAHEPVKGYADDVVGRECWDAYINQRNRV